MASATEPRKLLACTLCLDAQHQPPPIQCGCGCGGAAGSAHVRCKVEYAEHQAPGYHEGWYNCPTCEQGYTGAMLLGLAEALWTRCIDMPADDEDRLATQNFVAIAYGQAGRLDEAEALYRDLLATYRRLDGANKESTLAVATNLGKTLNAQGKHSEAEAMYRENL